MGPKALSMRCKDAEELLAALALGELDEPEADLLEAHLESCATCSQQLEQIRGAVGQLPDWTISPPAETLVPRTLQALKVEREGKPSWEERYHNFVYWLTHIEITPLRGVLATACGFCLFFLLINVKRVPQPASTHSELARCQENIQVLIRASQSYQQDRQTVPDRLDLLYDEYICSYPICPSARYDTYSESFLIMEKDEELIIYCGGHHHAEQGLGPNEPRSKATDS